MTGPHYAPPVITEIKGPDPTPPQITLKGGESLTLNVGDAWTDPGYTAIDARKRDITGLVSVSGSVDTSRPGEYRLTYSVTDNGGQKSSADRLVTVQEDKTDKPAIKSPATGGTSGALPPEPAPGGRAKSNPIATTQTGGPQKEVATASETNPAPPPSPTLKRPDLPDTSPFRPAAEPIPAAGSANPAPDKAVPNGSNAPSLLGPHRMPIPKALLQDNTKKGGAEEVLSGTGTDPKNGTGSKEGKSSSAGTLAETSGPFFGAIPIVAGALVILLIVGFFGWRVVYSRPIRRKPKN
jgi:hypothetical protein